MRTIRIGAGAGYSGDRIEPAIELAERGRLDYLVFECLAERTIALAQQARQTDPDAGFDALLAERFNAVLRPCVANKVAIITNMGAANPIGAARAAAGIARDMGILYERGIGPGAARVSAGRGRRGRRGDDRQAPRYRRDGEREELQGAIALRAARSGALLSARRRGGFLQ